MKQNVGFKFENRFLGTDRALKTKPDKDVFKMPQFAQSLS